LIIKKDADIPEINITGEGIKLVSKKVLIGPDDGSSNIIMRRFKVLHGGNTPFHSHDFEHVVKIQKGNGMVVNEKKEETLVTEGQSLFIKANEYHQFKNPFEEPFEFLCIILNPKK